jgi:hypothetical protein
LLHIDDKIILSYIIWLVSIELNIEISIIHYCFIRKMGNCCFKSRKDSEEGTSPNHPMQ